LPLCIDCQAAEEKPQHRLRYRHQYVRRSSRQAVRIVLGDQRSTVQDDEAVGLRLGKELRERQCLAAVRLDANLELARPRRELALAGREVIVLEAEDAIGTHTSSRNSEVIHAGIYYPKGSLKARACVAGRQLLYEYCASHGVSHRRCGKLIVATNESQLAEL